ncbi:MAG: tRNA (guanosine(46)-N7)-methyltransferase TrmB [Holosporales bacterium]|jgi:tRNA (guanine-N(7)-)-methyltransferase|nr:tRNA (guanosine(46)-N7)-methyltransferase TrmB [Holosporales bacterium]
MSNQHTWIQSFARTKGKSLSSRQKQLLADFLPQVVASKALFDGDSLPIQMEIGFGDGKHLVHQALSQPDTYFIGCEPFVNGAAKLLSSVDRLKIENIKVFIGDCRAFISEIPDDRISCIYVLFPDPWPKKRHHKRRLVQKGFLALIWRVLAPDGSIRFASDNREYAKEVFELVNSGFGFRASSQSLDLCIHPQNPWSPVMTKYEEKARLAGSDCFFIEALKVCS